MLNYFRNLYRVEHGRAVVAFITARAPAEAVEKYRQNGGTAEGVCTVQLSTGYPADMLKIYR